MRAFSLVELSIVLVILGLLTGGILAGQSLIRAAELRSVTSDYQRHTTAIQTFRDKYIALPGDMANATSFWGLAAACPGTSAQPSSTSATCNGNGNGSINDTSTNTASNEIFRLWQHLANAGLIEGTYTGVTGANHAHYDAVGGQNAPRSKVSNAGFSAYNWPDMPVSDTTFFEGSYGNVLLFGLYGSGGTPFMGFALRPEEAWNIDTKIDDGRPGSGRLLTYESHSNCHDTTPSAGSAIANIAQYRLTNTATSCALVFRGMF